MPSSGNSKLMYYFSEQISVIGLTPVRVNIEKDDSDVMSYLRDKEKCIFLELNPIFFSSFGYTKNMTRFKLNSSPWH